MNHNFLKKTIRSDTVINMGVIQEPCSLGLTPSASTAVMMAIADAICLVLMEQKHFTKEEYGLRHQGRRVFGGDGEECERELEQKRSIETNN
jgi:D-arabinose 5-phosphate isomerase GutQ